ncbi:unnamed protein product [Lactuca saligna]|uniref:Uncharacterized protein n=1 Tax=Lactuca saligna TaxID=75948 RepID=A0AA36A5Q4_LACSI|nr:unnamed protein product [Lactuca saligna]
MLQQVVAMCHFILLKTWSLEDHISFYSNEPTTAGLVLNAKPYFNEPGFAHSRGSANGEYQSKIYNETTLIYSFKTMVCTMKNPPKEIASTTVNLYHPSLKPLKGKPDLKSHPRWLSSGPYNCLAATTTSITR